MSAGSGEGWEDWSGEEGLQGLGLLGLQGTAGGPWGEEQRGVTGVCGTPATHYANYGPLNWNLARFNAAVMLRWSCMEVGWLGSVAPSEPHPGLHISPSMCSVSAVECNVVHYSAV